jgi:hypothetical protein
VRRTTEAVKFAIKDHGGAILEESGIIPVVRIPIMNLMDPDGWTVVSDAYVVLLGVI